MVDVAFDLIMPEGDFAENVKTNSGTDKGAGWGSLVEIAKSRPQGLTFGSWGKGSSGHLFGELIKSELAKWGEVIRRTGAKID